MTGNRPAAAGTKAGRTSTGSVPARPAPPARLAAGPAALTATTGADPVAVATLAAMLMAAHAAPAGALARESYVANQVLRDQLIAAIGARGGQAPPALPAYRLPVAPDGITAALTLLAVVEDACATNAHDAVGVLTGDLRALAVDTLGAAAVRAQRARLLAGLPPATAGRALPGM